jgi:hypothetical protein
MSLAGLRSAQARLARAEARADLMRAERDELIVTLAADGSTYREIARAAGLSLAAIGKIASAGGIRRYRPREGGEPTLTGDEDHGKTTTRTARGSGPGGRRD